MPLLGFQGPATHKLHMLSSSCGRKILQKESQEESGGASIKVVLVEQFVI